jgi:hypothetical protein
VRLGELEPDAACRLAELARAGLCGRDIASRYDNVVSLSGIELGDLAAEPACAADNDDRATGHYASPFGVEEAGSPRP